MKKSHLTLILVLIIPLIGVSSLFSQAQPELKLTEKDEQKLLSGKIIAGVERLPDSKIHKCQAMGIVYFPIDRVWETLGKYNQYNEFMPNTTVAFLVDPAAISKFENHKITDWEEFEDDVENYKIDHWEQNPFYFYNRFNVPWPWKDRHFILKMERNDRDYFSHWTEIVGNSVENKGSWKLIPFKGDNRKTLAIYTLHTDPGISLSPKLIEIGTKISLPDTIRALRKHILKLIEKEKEK